jgi:IS30 family transposase
MEKLQREWSPEEISKRLKIEYAWDMNMQVSHEAIYQYIYVLPRRELKKSLTYDQGKEMSEYEQFTIDTGIQVYFGHPGSPWERGTNENTNGLIRQYFSKGTDFTQVSKEKILEVQRKLNDRPRRALGYLKPDEVINQLVALKT